MTPCAPSSCRFPAGSRHSRTTIDADLPRARRDTFDLRGDRAHSGVAGAGDDQAVLREQFDEAMRLERRIDALRQRIPSFRCVVGCHDCCGPVTASATELARLPPRSEAERAAALDHLDCVYLGVHGCEVYGERPLICRLFGTTPRLACPNGKRPVYLIDARTEAEIHQFNAQTRQVLL